MLKNHLAKRRLAHLPKVPLDAEQVTVLTSAPEFKSRILALIEQAQHRIMITALYLQADTAGEQILRALFAAKVRNPQLDVTLYVDFHRAQRGLIGHAVGRTNADFYKDIAKDYPVAINIFGVPVKKRELFGVLHLKGFVFDNTVLYSGASINDVYLGQQGRYRADRYLEIQQAELADAMVACHNQLFHHEEVVQSLLQAEVPKVASFKLAHRGWLKQAKSGMYKLTAKADQGLSASLLMGLGRRGNQLNATVQALFETAEREILLYTPYFNFPVPLTRALRGSLKRGVKVTIVVGDKTSNDFYIPPEQKFSKIGGLPYLYETILRQFLKRNQRFIDSGLLQVRLWRHNDNSYHLKGISVDGVRHLFTGHNLNPRAWALDFENGIYVDDPEQRLAAKLAVEQQLIMDNTQPISDFTDVETVKDYPDDVRKLMSKIRGIKADFVLKRLI